MCVLLKAYRRNDDGVTGQGAQSSQLSSMEMDSSVTISGCGFEGRPRRAALCGSVHLSKRQYSGREFLQGSAVLIDVLLAMKILEDCRRSRCVRSIGTAIVASSSGVGFDLRIGDSK